jgi:hypothetical protein
VLAPTDAGIGSIRGFWAVAVAVEVAGRSTAGAETGVSAAWSWRGLEPSSVWTGSAGTSGSVGG